MANPVKKDNTRRIIKNFSDIKTFVSNDLATRIPHLDQINKNYYLFSLDRLQYLKQNKEDWKSNIKSLVTKMFADRTSGMLKGLDLDQEYVDVSKERTPEDKRKLSEEVMLILQHHRRQEDFSTTNDDIVSDISKEGLGNVKVEFADTESVKNFPAIDREASREKEKIIYKNKELSYKTQRVKLSRISNYNYFLDYHAKPDRVRWKIERHLWSDDDIRAFGGKFEGFTYDLDAVKKEPDYISRIDYEARKAFYAYANQKKKTLQKDLTWKDNNVTRYIDYADITDPEKDFNYDQMFQIKEGMNIREVILVNTVDQVDIWVNGVFHGSFPNPNPLEGYNTKECAYRRIEGTCLGIGVGHATMPIQQTLDTLDNSRIDNVLMSVHKVFKKRSPTSSISKTTNNEVTVRPWYTFFLWEGEDIEVMNMGDVPASSYRENDLQFSMLQGTMNLGQNALGMQGRVERVAWVVNLLEDAKDSQTNDFLNNYIRLRDWIDRSILILCSLMMSDEELEKILWTDNIFSTIDPQEFIDNITIINKADSMKDKFDAIRVQTFINFLNTVGGMVDDTGRPILNSREFVIEIADMLGITEDVINTEEVQTAIDGVLWGGGDPDVIPPEGGWEQGGMAALMGQIDPMAQQQWDNIVEQARAMQGMAWAVPPEMTTNAEWVN